MLKTLENLENCLYKSKKKDFIFSLRWDEMKPVYILTVYLGVLHRRCDILFRCKPACELYRQFDWTHYWIFFYCN